MIVTENVEISGEIYVYTYSDEGRYVVGGNPFGEYAGAYDPADTERAYTEGEIMAENETDDLAEAGKILLGVIE